MVTIHICFEIMEWIGSSRTERIKAEKLRWSIDHRRYMQNKWRNARTHGNEFKSKGKNMVWKQYTTLQQYIPHLKGRINLQSALELFEVECSNMNSWRQWSRGKVCGSRSGAPGSILPWFTEQRRVSTKSTLNLWVWMTKHMYPSEGRQIFPITLLYFATTCLYFFFNHDFAAAHFAYWRRISLISSIRLYVIVYI